MITLHIFCDLFWLLWLLPLLLGLLFWWLCCRKYKSMVADYEAKIKSLNSRISGLEDELAKCKSKRAELEGDLAITKGRMREMELESKKAAKANKGKASNFAASTPAPKASTPVVSSFASAASEPKPVAKPKPVEKPKAAKSIYAKVKQDNLQIIEGIGPKMESVLKENVISSFSVLASKSPQDLRNILNKYGDKYKIIDPGTWSKQASFAKDENFDGLIDLQKKLDGGKGNASGQTDSKLEKYLIKIGALKAFKQDDLKAIEGIGPATEKLLHNNGVKTWRELANTTADKLRQILESGGSRFSLGDPTTWPKQAEMAADGKFDELREYQDFLDGGKG